MKSTPEGCELRDELKETKAAVSVLDTRLTKVEHDVTKIRSESAEGINAYTAFMLAQDLVEDHPMFAQWLAAAKAALSVTDEQVEAILAAAAE